MHPSASWASRPEVRSLVILGVILAIGAALRLHGLGDRTLNHPEVYSPGIDLPWYLSNPNPRLTLEQTLKGSIAGEPHPPGYYILMLGWTRVFGSSILALRLPSVLFGVGSVLLVYLLGRLTADDRTALLASAMLALNGFHLLYSQTARMYSMACFFGLLSTWLLVVLLRRPARPLSFCVLYVLATLVGLSAHVYVWPLFLTQLLWVLIVGIRTRGRLVGLAQLQILAFVLATPLIAIATYQKSAATRPPTLPPLAGVLRYLEAGALFDLRSWGFSGQGVAAMAAIAALAASLLLLAIPATARSRLAVPAAPRELDGCGAVPARMMVIVALLVSSSILLFAYVAQTLLPMRSVAAILATCVLPPVVVVIAGLVGRRQERLARVHRILSRMVPRLPSDRSLVLALAFLPVGLLAAVSVVSPMFVLRGTLVFAPYLILVLAGRLSDLLRRDSGWAAPALALALVLGIAHGVSIVHYKSLRPSHDYKGLAARWAPEIEGADLIFVHGRGHSMDWAVAPIFYYLNARRYRYVGRNYSDAIRNNPRSRVWIMSLVGVPAEQEATGALTDYERRTRIEAAGLAAELYVPRAPVR